MGIPDLSVVVVTHNGKELALRTLRSAHAHVEGLDVEWFVVDSGSIDGTPDAVASEFPHVELHRRPNIGFAASNNVALERARGRYVLLLNPDIEIAQGTFAELIAALDERPEVGIASVVQQWPDGRLQQSIRWRPTVARQFVEALTNARWPLVRKISEVEWDERAYARETSADWLVGAFLIARREAIEQVGPMDDGFFLYSEEKDWCHRFGLAGWDVRHLPVMHVTHYAGGWGSAALIAQLSYSKLLFARKHHSAPARLAIRTALVLRHALRSVLLTPVALAKPGLRIKAAGERAALAVSLGIARPQVGPDPRGAAGGG